MALDEDTAGEDLEFLPSDDVVETEQAGAEEEAVRVHEGDEPRELLTVEAEDFDADTLDDDEADELEEGPGGEEEGEGGGDDDTTSEEEHEADLGEILHRHYGLADEDEGGGEPATGHRVRAVAGDEFVCPGCFLRKPVSQLADPAAGTCIDCT